MKAVRIRIGDLLAVIALLALFLGFFTPELRAWDRNTRVIFAVVGVITALFLVSFAPLWVVLFMLGRRSRRGLGVRGFDHVAVIAAFFSGFGILTAICYAIKVMVVR